MPEATQDIGDLTRRAQEALARGDAGGARALLSAAVATGHADVNVWLGLAHAAMLASDHQGKIAAIDKALELAPRDLRALIAKADHLDAEGDPRGASSYYAAALQIAPRPESLSPGLREALARARAANARIVRDLEDFVRNALVADGVAPADAPPRFAHAVDILFGRRRAYVQQPRYLFYPELANIQFFARATFPWIERVEAATDGIRDELAALLDAEFEPYVVRAEGRPQNDQMGLAGNRDWRALFLLKDGAETPRTESCPDTMAALQGVPLTRIPQRTPSVLFSRLAAGAHIPPHTGMLNTRLICHLPLIVPDGCAFRVGDEVREWREGEAWVFDDTIEHEAWNRSLNDRTILIFDVWRPELSEEERQCIASLCAAIDAYRGGDAWDN